MLYVQGRGVTDIWGRDKPKLIHHKIWGRVGDIRADMGKNLQFKW